MIPLIENTILIVLIIITVSITFFVYPFVLGSFPFLRARKLTHEDVAAIKAQGISHKTTDKGLKGTII